MTAAALTPLPLTVGPRTVFTVRRRLVRRPLGLAEALAGALPDLPPLGEDEHGYLITSLPAAQEQALATAHSGLRPFVRQRYRRAFTALDQEFETFLAGFSSKSRSTLRRKLKRFAEHSGGAIDLRCYRRADEMEEFHRHARAVSALTYQERLLGAGLPEDSLAEMRERAARDAVRGWILFLDARPVSYLHAPAEGDALVYAHLGYDPAAGELSPGTVLLAEALRALMAERRFRLFDFTEGEGAHKLRFASGTVDCVDLLLLRPTLGNCAAIGLIGGFDGAVAGVRHAAARFGLESLARRLLR